MYLTKINEIVDYIFTGGLEMPNLMTGIISHASLNRNPLTAEPMSQAIII